MPGPRTIRLNFESARYDVRLEPEGLNRLGPMIREALGEASGRAFLAYDDNLPPAAVERACGSLEDAGFDTSAASLHASEHDKSISQFERLSQEIAAGAHTRRDPVVALGGGIVGDLAGFAAGAYRRGCPVVQVPTTLLSMVDASVGGKTGVNLHTDGAGVLKNAVGVFHQPALVLIDPCTLDTLDDRHFRAGLAECIKHAMLSADFGDPELFEWTESKIAALRRRKPGALLDLIERNVSVKAEVVQQDERETGVRTRLNLGHTFAHAIEPLEGLSPTGDPADAPLHHGEAVALGLVAACRSASRLGLASSDLETRTRALLSEAGLPTGVKGLPEAEMLGARMEHDKKIVHTALRLILPLGDAPGRCELVDSPPPEVVDAGWHALIEGD